MNYPINKKFLDALNDQDDFAQDSTRAGFGRGLVVAGENDENVVALCADLTESIQMHLFVDRFPERFVEVGIAEQNLVTVASGMAHVGKIPFAASYAAFNPGRNWEQIRTTIALNNVPVKIVGSHAGLNVGPDGATHQMLEDIALMRVLPSMVVIAPGDAVEAEKVATATANDPRPNYIRLTREKSPIFSAVNAPFEIGKAYILRPGKDITICATGTMTANALIAAHDLEKKGISAEVIHVPTIKPLDHETILGSARKTGKIVTIEEHQIAGGFGSAVMECVFDRHCRACPGNPCDEKMDYPNKSGNDTRDDKPLIFHRIGINDRFGQSGTAAELHEHYGIDPKSIVEIVRKLC